MSKTTELLNELQSISTRIDDLNGLSKDIKNTYYLRANENGKIKIYIPDEQFKSNYYRETNNNIIEISLNNFQNMLNTEIELLKSEYDITFEKLNKIKG